MDRPNSTPPAPTAPNPDGSWFCTACRSFNRATSPACYRCGTPAPYGPVEQESSNRLLIAGAAISGLLAVVAIAALVLTGPLAATSTATPGQPAAAVSTRSASPSPSPSASVTPSPRPSDQSESPSASGSTTSATPTATGSAGPTGASRGSTAPTGSTRPGATPTVRTTAWPTATMPVGPTAPPTVGPTPPPAATGTPVPMVALPSYPVSIAGVTVSRYSISGATPAALESAMYAQGHAVCGGGDAVACFRHQFTWTYHTTTNGSGVCSVTSVDFSATYDITLPRWDGPSQVPQPLTVWFQQVLDHLVWHESKHYAIAQQYVTPMKTAILNAGCDKASQDAATGPVSDALKTAQDNFDAQDSLWSWPPYAGPSQ